MKTLECGHSALPVDIKLCPHLIGKTDVKFFRLLRGERLKYDVCCKECAELAKAGEGVELVEVCVECVRKVDEERWDFSGWVGTPGIEEQLEPLNYSIETIVFPAAMADYRAVFPLSKEQVLAFDGQHIGLFTQHDFLPILDVESHETDNEDRHKPLIPRLYVSQSGRYAALANDHGQFGQIFDLETARATMKLDRGDYIPDMQPFPVAFFQYDGRELVVHGSDWNRLEISDPANGELLTPRDSMEHQSSGESSEHYLDYFHGRLSISPDGKWIADDGWIWHPFGQVSIWNLDEWLDNDVYESEDGASRQNLNLRAYLWDVPLCWIDDSQLAIWGIGNDDEQMIDGVTIFDVKSGDELVQFVGPSKSAFWSDGKHLFSNENDGLHRWDIEWGVRTGRVEGFRADFQVQDYFVEVQGNSISFLTIKS